MFLYSWSHNFFPWELRQSGLPQTLVQVASAEEFSTHNVSRNKSPKKEGGDIRELRKVKK